MKFIGNFEIKLLAVTEAEVLHCRFFFVIFAKK